MIKDDFLDAVSQNMQTYTAKVFDQYGVFLIALLLGFVFGWYAKRWLSDRRYEKQINLRLKERDEQIERLNALVLDRMDKIVVEKKGKKFFNKLKRFFRNLKRD